jgi:hypothetical protein
MGKKVGVRVRRPVTLKLAWSEEKEITSVQLPEGTVVICTNKEKRETTFLLSYNGYAYRVKRSRLFERPGRAASELLKKITKENRDVSSI